MKRLLLVSLLALTSCAPILSHVQKEAATLTVDGTSVVFSNPGSDTARDVSVALLGPTLVTGADCHIYSEGWICKLGDVPAGQRYRLQVQGTSKNGSATFYRIGSGSRPVYIQM